MKTPVLAFCLLLATGAVQAQSQEEVGDADSFNRAVTWLGIATPPTVTIRENCEGAARCVQPTPDTQLASFAFDDLDSVRIPGRTTNSLICATFPITATYQFQNRRPGPIAARLSLAAKVVVTNSVLDNPALIDPDTGAPFNGRLTLTLIMHGDNPSLAVNQSQSGAARHARECMGGLVSKNNLKSYYGLTQAQADEFFRQPTTLSFGLLGSTFGVTRLDYSTGARLYGDRR